MPEFFYASELRQLDSEVEHYLSAEIRPGTARPEILIVPHAGYVYSAPVAAQAYLQLKNYAGRIKKRHPCRSVAPYGFQGHCRSVGR